MTFAKVLLLFLGLTTAEALLVRVDVSQTGYHVYAGDMKYRKDWKLKQRQFQEKPEQVEEVKVYFIDAQKTFFFSKTLGATLSRLKSADDRIPLHQERLSLDKSDSNIRIFRGEVPMENVDKDTRKHLELKTIYRSPTTLHIYIGEAIYFRVFTVLKLPGGGARVSFAKENIAISEKQFLDFKAKQPESLRFMYGTKEIVSTAFEWTSPESGLAVVRISDRPFETFRISGLEHKKDRLLVDILKFHPYFELEFNAALENQPTYYFRSTSQDAFINTFMCDEPVAVRTVTISRKADETCLAITSTSLGDRFQFLNLPRGTIQELKEHQSNPDPLFDFSVLIERSSTNIDFRVTQEVDNRSVYFKIKRQNDAVVLTLMTLDAKLAVVSKVVAFDGAPAHPLRLYFIKADESRASKKNLQFVRKIRLHTDMFDESDYCNNLLAAPYVNKRSLDIPELEGQWDGGYIYALSDPDSRLNFWHFHTFTETLVNKQTNIEETFTAVVFYDPKFAGLLTLGANSVNLQAPALSRMPFRSTLVSKDLPRIGKPDLVLPNMKDAEYNTMVHLVSDNALTSLTALPINPADPSLMYFHANGHAATFLAGEIDLVVKNLAPSTFHAFFYSINNAVQVLARPGRVVLTHRHRTLEFSADYVLDLGCHIRVIYKLGVSCTVITPVLVGSTVDFPEDSLAIIDLGHLRIEFSQTQIFKVADNTFLLVLTPFNSARLSEAQFEGLTYDKSDQTCAIPSERGLLFAVSNNAFYLFNAIRSLRFRASLSSVNGLLQLQTYQFEQQKVGRFMLKKSEDVDLIDRKGDWLQTGLISDLNNRLESLFFGADAHYFNRPAVHFTQKGDAIGLRVAHEPSQLTIRLRTDELVLEIPGADALSFVLSAPSAHSLDKTRRFFRLTLHFFGLDFEDITSSLSFKETEGVSSEGFELNKFDFAFKIATNGVAEYVSALVAALRPKQHSIHFSAEIFANKNDELVVLVHEQTRVSYHRLVDGVLQDEESVLTVRDKNKKLPSAVQGKIKKDFLNRAKNLSARDSVAGPSIRVESTDLVHPTANSVCSDSQCFPIGLFQGAGDNTFHIVTRSGELSRIQSSDSPLTVFAVNSLDKTDGFQVVDHSGRLML